MPSKACFKAIDIQPVTGLLDLRSPADQVPFGGYRWAMNVEARARNKLCRTPGFRRLLASQGQNNADLHDQLLDIATPRPEDPFFADRQPIQFLYRAITPVGFQKLFAATQNRIYVLNSSSLNWKIISDLLGGTAEDGCSDLSWSFSQVYNTITIANGRDPVVSYVIDSPSDASGQSVAPIQDLIDLNVTKAGLAFSWKNFNFLADVEQDGQRYTYRLMWSDYKRPLSFKQNATLSLAGNVDFESGEVILNAKPMGNFLMIYTSTGIWEMSAVGGTEVFAFRKRFDSDPSGSRALAYRNTLISAGDEHYYLGRDGLYSFNLYVPKPILVDWIHRATSVIFDEIDPSRCNVHVAGYYPSLKTMVFSWVPIGSSCPERILAINIEWQFISMLDYGATAFCNFAGGAITTLRDFLIQHCICDVSELYDLYQDLPEEGGYCEALYDPGCTEEMTPTSIYSSTPLDVGDGIVTEDWTLQDPDADSICALLGNSTLAQLCSDEFTAGECNPHQVFVFALSEDRCLKEISASEYYREICIDFTPGGCGEYELRGYRSTLRSGSLSLRAPDDDKIIESFEAELYPEAQTVPSEVHLRIGNAGQAVDPNTAADRCAIIWQDQERILLECQSDLTAAQYEAQGGRPDGNFTWPLYITGKFLYFELEITNPSGEPVDGGGACCMSRFSFSAAAKPRCR